MEKIYEQAKDLHVVATIIYNKGDEFAYADADCTKKFKTSELKEVFVKGALINIDGALYNAVSFNEGSINYVKAAGELGTLKSEADEVNE